MSTHVALLRAVNLPGHNQVGMADLRELCAGLGLEDACSLLQSGNLVFTAKGASASLERVLEAEAKKRLDLDTDFFVRTAKEWEAIMAGNPYPDHAERDPGHLVVVFLKGAPDRGQAAALTGAIPGREVARVDGRHVYVHYPDGIGRSKLTTALIEKKLGTRGTARNWNTVRKLGAMLTRTVLVVASTASIGGCAASRGHSGPGAPFEFALIGDMPYDGRHERQFVHVMKAVDAADLAFVVHDGDFWWDGKSWTDSAGGLPPCADATFQNRLELATSSRHPFIFVAGDNEWADCYRAKPRAYDPIERLAKLRRTFFSGDQSLGRRTIRLTRQSDGARHGLFRENARWVYGGVVFVTLHVIGSNNNLGRTPDMDAEFSERSAANLDWMRQAFELAGRDGNRAIMIIAQADPGFERTWPPDMQQRYMLGGLGLPSPPARMATGYDEFLAALEKETLAFGKPVVYVHGDTHLFRVDKPLVGTTSRRIIENFTRVETFGHPEAHWVRAQVDPNDPQVFRFSQGIVTENLVPH